MDWTERVKEAKQSAYKPRLEKCARCGRECYMAGWSQDYYGVPLCTTHLPEWEAENDAS